MTDLTAAAAAAAAAVMTVRINFKNLGISELKWKRMDEFNSD